MIDRRGRVERMSMHRARHASDAPQGCLGMSLREDAHRAHLEDTRGRPAFNAAQEQARMRASAAMLAQQGTFQMKRIRPGASSALGASTLHKQRHLF